MVPSVPTQPFNPQSGLPMRRPSGLLNFLLSPRGRLDRGWFFVGCIAILAFRGLALLSLSYAATEHIASKDITAWTYIGFLAIGFWISMIVTAKRFQDFGVSGWWTLLLAPFLILFGATASILTSVVLLLIPGSVDVNRYG